MPTHDQYPLFLKDHARLTGEEAAAFDRAWRHLLADVAGGRPPRRGLRVRQLATAPGVYELTWAPDGRATFEYGTPQRPGHKHIIWRRIGGHEIFSNP